MSGGLPSKGARTDAGQDRQQAARSVQQMFGAIAGDYDRLNHILSCGVDYYWWHRAARRFRHILRQQGAPVLDLCCGTGDMTFALYRRAGKNGATLTGADFTAQMLERARHKAGERAIEWVEADALKMPFESGRFALVTSAFGFRNLADYDAGLREICRVLADGGEVGILDFGMPKGVLGAIYRCYFRRILPAIGSRLSKTRGPYAYLPASVERFPAPGEMLERMKSAGFREAAYTPYTFGIAGLYWGKK
jgi:demethylmenaquinone methyltransferase/2-methoxy-6-polyprenyl-1,4-benzoquinol methylase